MSVKIYLKITSFYARKWPWKSRLRNDGNFVSASMCSMYGWVNASSTAQWMARYVKLRVAHAPGIPGTFSPPPQVSDPDMHHGTCVTHVPLCMPGSLTTGFLETSSWWRGKRSMHSRCMRNAQFYVSGKRSMASLWGAICSLPFISASQIHSKPPCTVFNVVQGTDSNLS